MASKIKEKDVISFPMEDIELLRSFVWKGCSDSELRFGLSVCHSLGLNPLLKHVVFIKGPHSAGNLYTTRDGLLHMAHQSGQFNGMQSGVSYDAENRKVIEGAWCRVYRKDMAYPFEVEVNFSEYYRQNSPVWQQYPAAMIKKVAEHMALKLAFNVSGLASIEEMGFDEKSSQEMQWREMQKLEASEAWQKDRERETQIAMKHQIEVFRQLQSRYDLTQEELQVVIGKRTLKGLTLAELQEVVSRLSDYCLGLDSPEPPIAERETAAETSRREMLAETALVSASASTSEGTPSV